MQGLSNPQAKELALHLEQQYKKSARDDKIGSPRTISFAEFKSRNMHASPQKRQKTMAEDFLADFDSSDDEEI